MPPKALKLLERLRRTKSGWRSKDLISVYKGFGFSITSGSNHDIVIHTEYKHIRDTLPRHAKELPKSYAADALKNIEEVLRLQKEGMEEDE